MKYNNIELKTSEDLKVMWRTCHYRQTKGPIEFDTIIVRFLDDIFKMLECSKSSSCVKVLLFIIVLLSYAIVCVKLC